jgi:hypothetical protein
MTMPPPPILPPPPPVGANLGTQLAKASWMAPIIGIALNVLTASSTNTRIGKLVIGLSSLGIYLLGLIFGIAALLTMRKHGQRGILAPAITGVTINGILVLLFAVVLIAAYMLR